MYGVMAGGCQLTVLISQLEHVVYLFFLCKATSLYFVNKYSFEGFVVSIKPGFPKLGQKNRTAIPPRAKLTYCRKARCGITNTDRALLLQTSPRWTIKAVFEIGLSKDHNVGCTQNSYIFVHTYKHTQYSDGDSFILGLIRLIMMRRNQTKKEETAIIKSKTGLR